MSKKLHTQIFDLLLPAGQVQGLLVKSLLSNTFGVNVGPCEMPQTPCDGYHIFSEEKSQENLKEMFSYPGFDGKYQVERKKKKRRKRRNKKYISYL